MREVSRPPAPGPGYVWVPPTTYTRNGKVIHRKGYWRKKRVTEKMRAAARRNIEKARRVWMQMSHEERARRMPGGTI